MTLLRPGDEQHCAHCGGWHVLELRNREDEHPHTRSFLYTTCRGQVYFAGSIGSAGRHETRPGPLALRTTLRAETQ